MKSGHGGYMLICEFIRPTCFKASSVLDAPLRAPIVSTLFPAAGSPQNLRPLEEGEGGRRSGKACVIDQTASMTERASTPSSIYLSDLQGRDEAVAQEGAQNSIKKGVHFETHRSRVSVHASHEALTLHLPVAHPAREVRVFKAAWCG
jgi:hypothetical protein